MNKKLLSLYSMTFITLLNKALSSRNKIEDYKKIPLQFNNNFTKQNPGFIQSIIDMFKKLFGISKVQFDKELYSQTFDSLISTSSAHNFDSFMVALENKILSDKKLVTTYSPLEIQLKIHALKEFTKEIFNRAPISYKNSTYDLDEQIEYANKFSDLYKETWNEIKGKLLPKQAKTDEEINKLFKDSFNKKIDKLNEKIDKVQMSPEDAQKLKKLQDRLKKLYINPSEILTQIIEKKSSIISPSTPEILLKPQKEKTDPFKELITPEQKNEFNQLLWEKQNKNFNKLSKDTGDVEV